MDIFIIVFLLLSFSLIVSNLINNKKISYSSILFVLVIIFYILKIYDHSYYVYLSNILENLDIYYLLVVCCCFIISLVEYLIGNKTENIKIDLAQDKESNNIINEDNEDLIIYMEMMEEPLAFLKNDYFILNNKMKKIIKFDNNKISKENFYSLISNNDRNTLVISKNNICFKFNKNVCDKLFEQSVLCINNKNYKLIRLSSESNSNKINMFPYKALTNELNDLEEKYMLMFFRITNYNDIYNFYGKDYTNIVISKHLSNIINIPFLNNVKIYYISESEYVILLVDVNEYNIIVCELENKTTLILNDIIEMADNKIKLISKIGLVNSVDVQEDDPSNVISKGLEMLSLACSENFDGNYAIYHELDNEINYNIEDLNINLDLDLNSFKRRIK